MKLLLVKLGAIGDGVMMLEALARVPGVEVTWICGKGLAPLVEATGLAKELILVDETRFYHGGVFGRVSEIAKVWLKLRLREFDSCLVAYRNTRYSLFTWFARCGRPAYFHPEPGRFHADELFLLLQKLCGNLVSDAQGETRVPGFASRPRPAKFTVAIAPGGAKNILRDDALRRWPLEKYHELAAKLIKEGCEVIYTGSLQDAWVREGMPAGVTDEIGKHDLLQLVNRFSACHAVVTHDSGPMHLARLAGVPVVALFGPTIPSEKVPPQRAKIFWGGENLSCRPCYNGQSYADCADNLCMKQITVEEVAGAVVALREKV